MTRFSASCRNPILLVPLVILAGCGPIGYVGRVSREASRSVAAAEAAGAAELAPYEYWSAVAYLDEARVMMTHSEYERSFDYGGRAKQLGEEALRKAKAARATPAPPNAGSRK